MPHFSCGVFGVASFINTFWSLWPDSNRRPAHYECAALPTEPHKQLFAAGTSLFSFTVFSVYHAFESSSIFFLKFFLDILRVSVIMV